MEAMTYEEMLTLLNEKYFISTSTYKRELPEICLDYLNILIIIRNLLLRKSISNI